MCKSSRVCRLASAALLLIAVCVSVLCKAEDKPLLWKVERDGQLNAYLFGSIHYAPENIYPLPAYVERAFSATTALAVELDITQISAVETMQVLAGMAFLTPPETLKDRMGEALWQRLVEVCGDYTCAPEQFLSYQPWLASLQLTSVQLASSGYSESHGVDRHFLQSAHADDKPVVELETLEQQLRVFSTLSDSEQLELLTQALNDMSAGVEPLSAMIQSWRRGDQAGLTEQVLDGFVGNEQLQGLYQSIFVQRNQAMLAKILRAESGPWFVVVGAGHMLGSEGLVAMLKKQGYQVALVTDIEANNH